MVHALLTRRDPLAAALAAGSMLLPREQRRTRLLAASLPVHVAISLAWGLTLARMLPERRTIPAGAAAGLGIAALDLGIAARLFPHVHALGRGPQLADHVAYGATVAAVVKRRRRDRCES